MVWYKRDYPWFDWYRQNRDALAAERGDDTSWLYVPVTIQITGSNSGTGYYPLEQAYFRYAR
ncbi:MAG: hypothetical protein IPH31_20860 [Lewinellaceae bacterium]|nr:hypothetical protein [Lewinellaceae bacterium]